MTGDPRRTLRLAARAMARHGLVHAYGHVSLRLDAGRFLVTPALPLGAVGPDAQGIVVPVDGPLPDGVLGEVRIHAAIYRARPDVGGICRVQPPEVMTLSALGRTPRALHGLGAYFHPAPPLWADPLLVRDDEAAAGVADRLGQARAVVLRGNGAVVVGGSLPQAAALAFFLEDAARVELGVLRTGLEPLVYDDAQAAARAVATGGLYERMWAWASLGDPEA